ncbi:MAG: GNAT family N-acetyltransferase [Pseudomonadota bacterium]
MAAVLRKVREGELHAISMVAEATDAPIPPFMGAEIKPSTADLRKAIIGGRIWVLAVPGRIDGYVLAYVRARELVVDALVVDKKASNQGVGQKLLMGTEVLARQKRCVAVLVRVTARIEAVISRVHDSGYRLLRRQADTGGEHSYYVKPLKAH